MYKDVLIIIIIIIILIDTFSVRVVVVGHATPRAATSVSAQTTTVEHAVLPRLNLTECTFGVILLSYSKATLV